MKSTASKESPDRRKNPKEKKRMEKLKNKNKSTVYRLETQSQKARCQRQDYRTSVFRGRFLGRVLVFLKKFFFSWTLSWTSMCFLDRVLFYFLVHFLFFFYKFPSPGWYDLASILIDHLMSKILFSLFRLQIQFDSCMFDSRGCSFSGGLNTSV